MAAPPAWMGFLDHDAVLVLTHPDAIRHVLHDNHTNYVKGVLYDDLRLVLGEGLLTSEGSAWVSQRKLAQPAFQASALEAYYPIMVETIEGFLREWRARTKVGRRVDILREMSRLTLRIITRCLFKVEIVEKEDSILNAITFLFNPASHGPVLGRVYKYLPLMGRIQARRALAEFEHSISWILGHQADWPDVMKSLSAGRPEATATSASRRLRDEVATFLLAGYETSALALTWALHAVSQHPEVEEKLRGEISTALDHRRPSLADLSRLPYTSMVIRETLRLYPPIPSFGRQALQDDVIAGFKIRAKTRLRIKPMLTHYHPDFWPDPERFRPERFSSEQAGARPQSAYLPFGAGPRTCIGNNFAMMEMRLALAMILQVARFRSVQTTPVPVISNVTLRPRHAMWMIPEFSSDGRWPR